jgi:hypothetical protein
MKQYLGIIVVALLGISGLYATYLRHRVHDSATQAMESTSPQDEEPAPPTLLISPPLDLNNKARPDPFAHSAPPIRISTIPKRQATSDVATTQDAGADAGDPAVDQALLLQDPSLPEVPETLARAALDYVGIEPDANVIWIAAINDPRLSDDDRQNLIEDLNENGFADPKNPTLDDLPMIENRIALIETLAPDAMDDVNLASFEEAYKDLTEMRAKLVAPANGNEPANGAAPEPTLNAQPNP